jgi:hypothetical protein
MSEVMNEARCQRLVSSAISRLKLDLSGFEVLTEAATGYYSLTPLIAALAGARKVYALARDSRYARGDEVRRMLESLAARWRVSDRVEVLLSRDDSRITRADIVTNLGFVRPIDKEMLSRLKPTAVIPLMWETWEYRPEDLDLAECRRLGIAVLGTNEQSPELMTFKYVGLIALKLLLLLGVECQGCNVALLGSGPLMDFTGGALRAVGAKVTQLQVDINGTFDKGQAREAIRDADALVVVELRSREMLIGEGGYMNAEDLFSLNPGLAVAHLCGFVERGAIEKAGLQCMPGRFAPPGFMSLATDYVGPKPLIDLHAAGLKVGENLARARVTGMGAFEAEELVLERSGVANGFAGYHSDRGCLLLGAASEETERA